MTEDSVVALPIVANIAELRAHAHKAPAGYVDYVLSRGRISGDRVFLDGGAQNDVREKYPVFDLPGVFSLSILKATAAYQPAGFAEFILSNGKTKGDAIVLNTVALVELNRKFPPIARVTAFRIADLKESANSRPPGYVDFVLSRGKVVQDLIVLQPTDAREAQQKFFAPPPRPLKSLRLKVSELKAQAEHYPIGLVDYMLAHGQQQGDFVVLDDKVQKEVNEKFPRQPQARFNLSTLKATADKHAPGFVDFILAHGKVDGEMIVLDDFHRQELTKLLTLKKIKLSALQSETKFRPKGFYDFVLSNGKIYGEWIFYTETIGKEVTQKFPTVRFKLDALQASAPRRPEGFVNYLFAHGKIIDGSIMLPQDVIADFNQRFPQHYRPAPDEVSLAEMTTNFAGAMAGWVKAGFKTVDRKIYDHRLATCSSCEHWNENARVGMGKCGICGCSKFKFWLTTSKCPDKPPRW